MNAIARPAARCTVPMFADPSQACSCTSAGLAHVSSIVQFGPVMLEPNPAPAYPALPVLDLMIYLVDRGEADFGIIRELAREVLHHALQPGGALELGLGVIGIFRIDELHDAAAST